MLNISINTLLRWRKDDIIKFPEPMKVQGNNGKNLWVEEDIEEWIKDNK